MGFPPVPAEIKPVAHLMKLAEEHESRNLVVTYWARLAACQLAVRLLPSKRTPEVAKFLETLLSWLEETKKANLDNEGITNEMTAAALIEEYALQMFKHGDQQDRAEIYNKNTVKTFYTAGMLMDVLDQFGLSDDIYEKRKYAKWKAAYIHNCLKAGEQPIPGGPDEHLGNVINLNELTEEERAKFQWENENREPEDNIPTLPPGNGSSANSEIQSPQTPPAFVPAPAPAPTPSPSIPTTPSISSSTSASVSPEIIQKAQKYCKYATSALNYDDVKTAIDNLTKALSLLQTGRD